MGECRALKATKNISILLLTSEPKHGTIIPMKEDCTMLYFERRINVSFYDPVVESFCPTIFKLMGKQDELRKKFGSLRVSEEECGN